MITVDFTEESLGKFIKLCHKCHCDVDIIVKRSGVPTIKVDIQDISHLEAMECDEK